jgi:hypothetical protein
MFSKRRLHNLISELPEETPETPTEYGSWYFGEVTSTAVGSRGPQWAALCNMMLLW